MKLIKMFLDLFKKKPAKVIPFPEVPKKEVPKEEEPIKLPVGRVKHENTGACLKCQQIFNEYPGVHPDIKQWFEFFQDRHPEAHISTAGRGREKQEEAVRNGKSKAHWGYSAHNYGCAVDIFEMTGKPKDIYEKHWFESVLKPNLREDLYWYGEKDSPFYELPHVQIKNWKELKAKGLVKLVE